MVRITTRERLRNDETNIIRFGDYMVINYNLYSYALKGGDKMTFKELTEVVAEEEGLDEEVNIAQIKEIVRITLTALANAPFSSVAKLLSKYEEK